MSNGFFDLLAHASWPRLPLGIQAVRRFVQPVMRQILRHASGFWGAGGKIATMALSRVLITTEDFNLADEVAVLRANDTRVGAVCTFTGTVRDRNDGQSVSSMELEHYPGMTEKAIEAMIDEAMVRFDIFGARVIHRVGLLQPLDQVVMVAVTSAHRGESFKACEFLMDYLKTQAPFWKKEQTPEGARWVDARVSDDAALAKWGIQATNG